MCGVYCCLLMSILSWFENGTSDAVSLGELRSPHPTLHSSAPRLRWALFLGLAGL